MPHCAIKIISNRLGGRDSKVIPHCTVLILLMAMIQVVLVVQIVLVLVVASADRIGTSPCFSKGEGGQ